jgi:hypothetical protein
LTADGTTLTVEEMIKRIEEENEKKQRALEQALRCVLAVAVRAHLRDRFHSLALDTRHATPLAFVGGLRSEFFAARCADVAATNVLVLLAAADGDDADVTATDGDDGAVAAADCDDATAAGRRRRRRRRLTPRWRRWCS